jgi:hypothetical protein
VLRAATEQRIELLLVDRGFSAPGAECPNCGWLSDEATVETCPLDGTPVIRRDDIVEAAIERSILQSGDVFVVRDRPELASHGRIAAVLRF